MTISCINCHLFVILRRKFVSKIKNLQVMQQVLKFFFQTIFYTVIIFALVYLYGYSGLGQGHFIYNEF